MVAFEAFVMDVCLQYHDQEHPWDLARAWNLMRNASSVLEKDLLTKMGFLPSCLSSEMESNIVP
jgi:hypothetical protein